MTSSAQILVFVYVCVCVCVCVYYYNLKHIITEGIITWSCNFLIKIIKIDFYFLLHFLDDQWKWNDHSVLNISGDR